MEELTNKPFPGQGVGGGSSAQMQDTGSGDVSLPGSPT